MTLHDVLRAIVLGDGALLNDTTWVQNALAAIAANEAKYPSPAAAAPAQEAAPVQDAVPDPRDAEIERLKAELQARVSAEQEGSPG